MQTKWRNPRFGAVALCFFLLSSGVAASPLKLAVGCSDVSVSSFHEYGSVACRAVDGDSSTYWNAGRYAPQWILIDLGRPRSVYALRLQVLQLPDGITSGVIMAGPDLKTMTAAYSWNRRTTDQEWLEFSGDHDQYRGGKVRFIRVAVTSSPSWVGWREIEVYGGVEFFGYFQDVSPGDDAMSETISAGANLTHIFAQSVPDLAAKLAEAKQLGVKAMVSLSDLIFTWEDQAANDRQLLDSFWLPQWADIVTLINSGYRDTVAAFYLFDEPYLSKITPAELTRLAERVHTDLPEVPTAAVMDANVLVDTAMGASWINMKTSTGRSTLDWVGYDCYDQFENCYGHPLNVLLRSAVNADQRLIAVPGACSSCGIGMYAGGADSSAQAAMIRESINAWHEEIVSDSKYIAVLAFLWAPSGNMQGAKTMPFVRSRLQELALSLIPTNTNQVFAVRHAASSTYQPSGGDPGQFNAFAAFDLDTGTVWNAGASPAPTTAPWVEADFGTLTRVTGMQLLINQDITGDTDHAIYGTIDRTTYFPLTSFQQVTEDGGALTWSGSVDVVAIRIKTAKSPSWVAWRDVQFFLH